MMNCREAARLMSDELDRELGASRRFALRLHLLLCRGCRHYRQQMAFLRRACRQETTVDEAPPAG